MYLCLNLRKIIFNDFLNLKAVVLKKNEAILVHNIPHTFLGFEKSALLAFHPNVKILELSYCDILKRSISAAKKIANKLPDIGIINSKNELINLLTLHLEISSYLKYFKAIDKFLNFLNSTFETLFQFKLDFVISPNPFLNILLSFMHNGQKIWADETEALHELKKFKIRNCFLFSLQERNKFFHLRFSNLFEILNFFDNNDITNICSSTSAEILTNIKKSDHRNKLLKIQPECVHLIEVKTEIWNNDQLKKIILSGVFDCLAKLNKKSLKAENIMVILKSNENLRSVLLPFSEQEKEIKAICNQRFSEIITPIQELCIIPVNPTFKTAKQHFFVQESDKPPKFFGLKRVIATNNCCPEISFKYVNADSRNERIQNKQNSYPPIIFKNPIKINVLRIANKRIMYVILGKYKLKITRAQPDCHIYPEWWNLGILKNNNQEFTKPRQYYKALTENGVLLWLLEIEDHFYLHGLWA